MDSEKNILFYTTILYDVAKSAGSEAQMLQAHKMEAIGELAAGIAHEINTPTQFIGDNIRFFQESFKKLSPVLLKCAEYTKALKEGENPAALLEELDKLISSFKLEYFVREIPNAVEQSLEGNRRVAEIVSAMKELTHPSMEDMMAIDINNAIKSTISVARNEWKYVAEIETEFDQNLPKVLCLPGQFNQAMLNLIVNAGHAIKEKHRLTEEENKLGNIKITTKKMGRWVEIQIQDTGTGIPKDIWTRIYDPFFTTKDVGKGTGQGLASVHFIVVEKHHGAIEFKTQDGVGTTFTIRLPIDGDIND
jgi:signal transduction histidine kinase